MAGGEIVIDEELCKGCGLCEIFCSRGCIEIKTDRLSAKGVALPVLVEAEKCNACAVCGWMCPDFAIEVYKYED